MPDTIADSEIFHLYGRDAVITRIHGYTLVHLDRPSPELVDQRIRDFNPTVFFDDSCPICQRMRDGGVIVFDDSPLDMLEGGHDDPKTSAER